MINIFLDSLRNGSEFHRDFAGQTVAFLSRTLSSAAFNEQSDAICAAFADHGGGGGPAYVAAVREWPATTASVFELRLDILLAVDLPGMPGQESPPPASGIVTPYWFIDDCIRREDHASLGAQWIREWLIGTYRETEARRGSVTRPTSFSGGNASRPEFLLPPGLQALVDFAVSIHDAIRDYGK